MKRIVSIVLPDGYEDAEEFAKDCGVEIWHSHTLRYLSNVLNRIRSELLQNKPVQAYTLIDDAMAELEKKLSESNIQHPEQA